MPYLRFYATPAAFFELIAMPVGPIGVVEQTAQKLFVMTPGRIE
jgi:hypothetical protein